MGLAILPALPLEASIDLNRNGFVDPYEDSSLPRATRVADLISRMTLEEKSAQLTQMQLMTTSAKSLNWTKEQNEIRRKAVREGLGSILFFDPDVKGRNEWQRLAVNESRLGIPLVFGMDIIHGDALIFPISLGLACSFEPELFEKAQAVAAREAASSGIDWVFAPMCDLSRDPRWGRVSETCGEDPYLAACCCAAQVRGFQGDDPSAPDRVAACLKHFVGYSAVTGGRDYNDSEITRWTLWNMHLPSFRAAVKSGALTVMSSFNTVEGVPAVACPYALTDVLRDVFGFKGFVVSDWNSIGQLLKWRCAADKTDAARLALNAGNDMDMMSGCYREGIPESVRRGLVSPNVVDESVRRVLDVKMRLGLFEKPYVDEGLQEKVREGVDRNERELARVCAERSMVLLKNDGILPLNATKLCSVALVGPVAEDDFELNGSWSFRGRRLNTTIAAALKAALPGVRVEVIKGCSVNTGIPTKIGQDGVIVNDRSTRAPDDELDIIGAVRAAQTADIVILALAETREWTGENGSRSSLGLSGRQQELFDAVATVGKPVVSIVFSGRPLVLPEVWERSAAVFYAWQPGSEGPRALANLLVGAVGPSGRLAISVPSAASQLPVFYNRPSTGNPGGGQYRDTKEQGPRYPFGYGLTYTAFEYGKTIVQGGKAKCSVKNVGKRVGTEVVQLYVRQEVCNDGWRPVCELRGFERVTLSPGETKEVSFALTPTVLGYVRRDGRETFDPGVYRVWIAPNSRDLGEGVLTEVGVIGK